MKGQVSLESLIVIAAFLGVLALWLGGVAEANAAIALLFGAQQESLAAEKLAAGINSVCVMGHGNRIELDLRLPGNASVREADGRLVLAGASREFEREAYCEFAGINLTKSQRLALTNNKGFVEIS